MQQDTIVVVSVLRRFGRLHCAPKFFGLLCLLALLPFLSFGTTARASEQTAPQAALVERPVVNAEGDSANTASRDTTAALTDGAEASIPVPEAPADMPPPDFFPPPPPPPGPEPDPAFFDPSEPPPKAPPLPQPLGFVAHCFDGDTFKLTDRRVVRLAGIDAPELSKGDRKGQLFAREARGQLTDLTQGQQVMLLQAGVKHRDIHGRILAEVLLPDGSSLNEIMVRNGAAYFYPHRDLSPQLQERLRNLQHEAIAERRGMWGFLLSQPVAKNTYLGNKESLRFFPADCAEAQSIRPRNRVYFGNLMDAFMAGYAPARVCPFWPVTP
ncbi:MAG: thermonuclease family protein [Desulfovibrio sp.]|uniref:thermonuclease family protein n=1 Tax=Desulfovibrio sp. TaxID=885 RepID=UPI0039E4F4F0